jgi:hypothetical protein
MSSSGVRNLAGFASFLQGTPLGTRALICCTRSIVSSGQLGRLREGDAPREPSRELLADLQSVLAGRPLRLL